MAITLNGVENNLTSNELPTGYTVPTVATFSDWEYKSTLNLTVLKATVENATASITMDNIFDDGTIGLTKQVTDILAADYLATATVTAYAELVRLSNNYASINGAGTYLTSTANSYECKVLLYVKTA